MSKGAYAGTRVSYCTHSIIPVEETFRFLRLNRKWTKRSARESEFHTTKLTVCGQVSYAGLIMWTRVMSFQQLTKLTHPLYTSLNFSSILKSTKDLYHSRKYPSFIVQYGAFTVCCNCEVSRSGPSPKIGTLMKLVQAIKRITLFNCNHHQQWATLLSRRTPVKFGLFTVSIAFSTSFVTRYVKFLEENEIIGEFLHFVIYTDCFNILWLIKIMLDRAPKCFKL